jgi:hypothetical protein
MDQPLISLDQSRNPARFDRPEVKKPHNPELRWFAVAVIAVIFLAALIMLIWLILSLFNSKYAFDALPLLNTSKEAKSLNL